MTILEIVWAVIALVAVVGCIALVLFLRRLHTTLDHLDSTMAQGRSAVENLEGEVQAALRTLVEAEKRAGELMENLETRLDHIEAALVPTVEEIGKTARAYRGLEQELEQRVQSEVPILLADLKRISGDISEISGEILKRIDQTKELFQAVEESGRTVKAATRVARSGLTGLAIQVASMAVGVKSSLEYVSENLIKKE